MDLIGTPGFYWYISAGITPFESHLRWTSEKRGDRHLPGIYQGFLFSFDSTSRWYFRKFRFCHGGFTYTLKATGWVGVLICWILTFHRCFMGLHTWWFGWYCFLFKIQSDNKNKQLQKYCNPCKKIWSGSLLEYEVVVLPRWCWYPSGDPPQRTSVVAQESSDEELSHFTVPGWSRLRPRCFECYGACHELIGDDVIAGASRVVEVLGHVMRLISWWPVWVFEEWNSTLNRVEAVFGLSSPCFSLLQRVTKSPFTRTEEQTTFSCTIQKSSSHIYMRYEINILFGWFMFIISYHNKIS